MTAHSPHRINAAPMALMAALLALWLGGCERRDTLLTVHATATTRTAPDLAIVTLGVVARGANARAAQAAQAARMEAVMQAVRAAGVEEAEVQTVGYSLEPQYTYPRGGSPRITGYQSRNIVSVRVRDLNAVSGLIDATVADGANELQGIQFTFQDNEAARNAARAQALETARARAEAYASAVDMKVARVDSITEPGGAAPPLADGYGRAISVAAEQSANLVAPGQLDSQSSVTVVFVLR
jgi:uncharacterized protein YggE